MGYDLENEDYDLRNRCPEGLDSCKECPRYMDDCDGIDEEKEAKWDNRLNKMEGD